MSQLSLDLSVSVTGGSRLTGPLAHKMGFGEGNKEGKELKKTTNSSNDLRRKVNLLIVTGEIQVNWD